MVWVLVQSDSVVVDRGVCVCACVNVCVFFAFLRPRGWLLPMAVFGVAPPLVWGCRLLLGIRGGARRPGFPLHDNHSVLVSDLRVPPEVALVRLPRG